MLEYNLVKRQQQKVSALYIFLRIGNKNQFLTKTERC